MWQHLLISIIDVIAICIVEVFVNAFQDDTYHTHTHTHTVYKPETALPLPTYAQSQKYEQDGVLELSEDEEPDSTTTRNTTTKLPGSCLDFTLFFLSKLY